LPEPGGPLEKKMMRGQPRDLERATRRELAANIGQVVNRPARDEDSVGAAAGTGSVAARIRVASQRDRTGWSLRPWTMPASGRFADGKTSDGHALRLAATAIGSSPCIGGMPPSSDRPPTTVYGDASRRGSTPEAARMPSAIGRSNAAPTFLRSDGARLTMIRVDGKGKPELR